MEVNGYHFPAMLDTGAELTLMPKEFVKEEDLIGETEQVRGSRKDVTGITTEVLPLVL